MFQPLNYRLFLNNSNLSGYSIFPLFETEDEQGGKFNFLSLLKFSIITIKEIEIPDYINIGKDYVAKLDEEKLEEKLNKISNLTSTAEEELTKTEQREFKFSNDFLIQFIFFNFSGKDTPSNMTDFINEIRENGEKLTITKHLNEDGSIKEIKIGEGFEWLKDNLKYFNLETFKNYFGDKWKVSSDFSTGTFTNIYNPLHLITKAYIYAKRKYFNDNGITEEDKDDTYIYNKIEEYLKNIKNNIDIEKNCENLISFLQALSFNFMGDIPLMITRKSFMINFSSITAALAFLEESSSSPTIPESKSFSFFSEVSEEITSSAEAMGLEVINFKSTKYIGKINYTDITIFKEDVFNLTEEKNLDLRCIFSVEPGKFKLNDNNETVEIMYFYGEPKDFRVFAETTSSDCKILRPINYLKFRGLYPDRIFFRYSGCPFTDHYFTNNNGTINLNQYFFIDIVF